MLYSKSTGFDLDSQHRNLLQPERYKKKIFFVALGLFGFSLNESIVCCPDKQVGYIHIRNLGTPLPNSLILETQQSKPPAKAHSTPLSFLEINQSGTLIATASEKVPPIS